MWVKGKGEVKSGLAQATYMEDAFALCKLLSLPPWAPGTPVVSPYSCVSAQCPKSAPQLFAALCPPAALASPEQDAAGDGALSSSGDLFKHKWLLGETIFFGKPRRCFPCVTW